MSRESDEIGEEQFWAQFDPSYDGTPDIFGPEDIGPVEIEEGPLDLVDVDF